MDVNEHFYYLVEEVNRADLLFENGMPYDLVLMIKEHLLIDILDRIKARMILLDDTPVWADLGEGWSEKKDEFDLLDKLTDRLMNLEDDEGNLILGDAEFEKFISNQPSMFDEYEIERNVGRYGDWDDWDAYPDDWY
jgi:hypothetical protein